MYSFNRNRLEKCPKQMQGKNRLKGKKKTQNNKTKQATKKTTNQKNQ